MPTTTPARGDDANPLLELVDAATQRLQTAGPVAASKRMTGAHMRLLSSLTSYSATEAETIMLPRSSLGPLPRNASTAA